MFDPGPHYDALIEVWRLPLFGAEFIARECDARKTRLAPHHQCSAYSVLVRRMAFALGLWKHVRYLTLKPTM